MTIGEMAQKLSVATSTLRYYDKEGLLPFVERTQSGIRVFKESDYEWLRVIECLKKTGMQLKDIKRFVEMAMQGEETVEERLELIVKQKNAVEEKIMQLQETLEMLNFKQWYYETAKEKGLSYVSTLDDSKLPQEFREVRKNLKGKND